MRIKILFIIGIVCSLAYSQAIEAGDWTNIRLYGHAYNVNDFSDTEYDWIKDHYSLFTIEKRHARVVYGDMSSERASEATAAKIIENNPNAEALFYWNTAVVYDEIYETIDSVLAIHPEWKDESSGKWTYTDEEFRNWYIDVVKDQVNNKGHSGVFLDGAMSVNYFISSEAADYLLEMMDEMPGIVIYNGFAPNGVITAALDYLEHADGVFVEHFFRAHCNTLAKGKMLLDELLKISNDKIIIANSEPEDTFWNTTDHKFSLAAFLIIANDNSYYHYFTTELYASEYMTFWDEDFEEYLGEPKGVATVSGVGSYVYTREFENALVTLDLENKTSSIEWGSGIVSAHNNTISTQSFNSDISINQNHDNHMLSIKAPTNQKNEYTITNISGQRVITGQLNSNLTSIDLSNLSAGVYNIRVLDGNKIYNKTTVVF